MPQSAERPLVSVLLQAYNVAPFVGEALRSVLAQHLDGPIEVLAIDDGSTDGTGEILRQFSDPRLRIVTHDPNVGAIATANEGYAAAAGEFVLRLDADDRLRPGALQVLSDALRKERSCDLAYGDVETIDTKGEVVARDRAPRDGRPAVGDEFWPLVTRNFISAPATLVRRTALNRLLPVPAHFRYLDWYLTTGLAEGAPTVYVDQVVADYRLHAASMHHWMVADGSGERTTMEILDRLFAGETRRDDKRRWRRRVYAAHYVEYGDKYFGAFRSRDARRCYWTALRLRPGLIGDAGIARRLIATFGRRGYERIKQQMRAATPEAASSARR